MVRKISSYGGFQPELRKYLENIEDALNGDIVMDISPETVGSPDDVTTRTVTVTIQNAAGDTLEWVNAAFATTVSKTDDTAGDGSSALGSTTLTLVNGVGTITVTYSDTWAADDTQTVTVGNIVLAGITITGGTSVDTIVAS